MDVYDFKNMGHSGFDHVRIVDFNSYNLDTCTDGCTLFEGDLDDAPDALDGCEVVSIDVCLVEGKLDIVIDVGGADAETYGELGIDYPFALVESTNIVFTHDGVYDEVQFDTRDEDELKELFDTFVKECGYTDAKISYTYETLSVA